MKNYIAKTNTIVW